MSQKIVFPHLHFKIKISFSIRPNSSQNLIENWDPKTESRVKRNQ
jgi:hypothetical protein